MKNISASVDKNEIDKFSRIAEEWWDPKGKFKPLHEINSIRIKYLLDTITKLLVNQIRTIRDISILDIGCGGGLLAEPFARLGCKVTAIDASQKNIEIAKLHAKNMMLEIDYRNVTVEELAGEGLKWDVILNMEVIEHVEDVDSFVSNSAKLLNPDGVMFVSTINRNIKSYFLTIVAAEYILRWLPKGTHNYNKFLKPSDIDKYLRKNNLTISEIKGICYNILNQTWNITDNIDVNYIIAARK